jgi:hypothetical protein
MDVKKFYMAGTWKIVINFFTFVSYEFLQEARAFVHGKPFQPSLMFAGKAGAYLNEGPFRCSTPG